MNFINHTANKCKYYLYQYIRLDISKPFYIGVGTHYHYSSDFSRAKTSYAHNILCRRIVAKTDYLVDIIEESDDYEYIKQREIELIKIYGKIKDGTGTLANFTDGGEGMHGYSTSNKKVYAYKKTGEFVAEFKSLKSAANYFKTTSGNIGNSARLLTTLAKNHQFRFFKVDSISPILSAAEKMKIRKSREVLQMDYNGCLIKEWNSITEITNELGFDNSLISQCCRGKINDAKGYIWRYKSYKENEIKPPLPSRLIRKKKIILQYDKQNQFIKEWECTAAAAKELGIPRSDISRCALGKRKTAGGFTWKFLI